MRFGGRYVLGVDGLPRGRRAAVAVGRSIAATYELVDDGGGPLPLSERLRQAVAEAEVRHGALPAEIRIVCVDDGGDGDELERIDDWVRATIGVPLIVLDLVAPPAGDDPEDEHEDEPGEVDGGPVGGADHAPVDAEALSVARACEAALW